MSSGDEEEIPDNEEKITLADFARSFGNSNIYFDDPGFTYKEWPHFTILVAKLTKIGNEPTSEIMIYKNTESKHVELFLIEDLKDKLSKNKDTYDLEIFSSYSPCSDASNPKTEKECSQKLIEFKRDHKNMRNIHIKFGTFYNHKWDGEYTVNWKGLKKLHRHGITLDTLGGADWEPLLRDVFHKLFNNERIEREKTDKKMMSDLMSQLKIEVLVEEMIELRLAKNWKGLENLLRGNSITLDTQGGEDWKPFLRDVLKIKESKIQKWFIPKKSQFMLQLENEVRRQKLAEQLE